MTGRYYYQQHRERLLAASRAWKKANPERSRRLNREHMRRAALRKKAAEKRRASGRAWYAAHRDQERERARRFRQQHPEKVREYQARYRANHPERAAEQSRLASQRWRDRNADLIREKQRAAAERSRRADPEAQRRWYHANLEQQRARGREASRLRSRLKRLGLPPRSVHRTYAADKRANTAAGDAFFTRHRTPAEKTALTREAHTPHLGLDAHHRITGTPGELQHAASKLQHALRAGRARDLARQRLLQAAQRIERTHGARIRRDVEMDSTARRLRGQPAYDIDQETRRRIAHLAATQTAPTLPTKNSVPAQPPPRTTPSDPSRSPVRQRIESGPSLRS